MLPVGAVGSYWLWLLSRPADGHGGGEGGWAGGEARAGVVGGKGEGCCRCGWRVERDGWRVRERQFPGELTLRRESCSEQSCCSDS